MPAAKAANVAAASPADAPRSPRRYTPPQSAIAPSVTIVRKHRTAISTTAREGSRKCSPAAVALPGPSPVRQAESRSSSSPAATAFCTRGSAPAAVAAATPAAPAKPPKLQPACSEDMIGRPSRPSIAEPWAFIETSIDAPAAPNASSANGSR